MQAERAELCLFLTETLINVLNLKKCIPDKLSRQAGVEEGLRVTEGRSGCFEDWHEKINQELMNMYITTCRGHTFCSSALSWTVNRA